MPQSTSAYITLQLKHHLMHTSYFTTALKFALKGHCRQGDAALFSFEYS